MGCAETVFVLLRCVHAPLEQQRVAGVSAAELRRIPEYAALGKTVLMIWRDTLNKLIAVRALSTGHRLLKVRAVREWKKHGTLFGIGNGYQGEPLDGASQLSEERAYWNIPKRCFLKSCPCSAMEHPLHMMHVCKGCYRVLYCNENCQRL